MTIEPDGFHCTAGRIEPGTFEGGWAKPAFGGKPHHYSRSGNTLTAACGRSTRDRGELFFNPGSFPYCRVCVVKVPPPANVLRLK